MQVVTGTWKKAASLMTSIVAAAAAASASLFPSRGTARLLSFSSRRRRRTSFSHDFSHCQRQLARYSSGNFSKMSGYTVEQRGTLHKEDFRLFFKDVTGKFISPFHDIPLFADESKSLFNMVVEVPRWTNAKMEITRPEKLNPIKQDVKKGAPRFVANCYPFVGYMWNYGALPQTWEDPAHVDASTGCKGDGDPIDVCEIGQRVKKRGEVIQVKVLGVIALVDEGETDWKLLAIDNEDPLASQVNNVSDVEKHMPGLLADTVKWFKIYKMPDGKPPNEFAFNGEAKDRSFALNVIAETNEQWRKMMTQDAEPKELARICTTFECSSKVTKEAAESFVCNTTIGVDLEHDSEISKWHFIKL